MAIKVVVDSATDISMKDAEQMGIIMVPMTITIGSEEYQDGVSLLPKEFYEKLIESDNLPKTSQINSFAWKEVFERYTANGNELVVITISSKLSGTYNSARMAAEEFGGRVVVIDSLNAAIGERLLAEYAIRLVDNGWDINKIVDELEEKKNKIHLMAMLGTLEYLKKGGRISGAVAIAGKLLSIKPVIAIIDGEVKMIGKAMGSKNGSNLLNKLVADKGGIDFNMPFGVVWSGLDDSTLNKYVEDSSNLWQGETNNIPKYMLGGTIGTHVGPGAIGVAFFEK